MALVIDLTPQEESRLRRAAEREGIPPAALAKQIVTRNLPDDVPCTPETPTEDPTIALFRKWEEEDAVMTSEEIEAAQREWEEFKNAINETRRNAGMRILYP